MEAGEGSVAVPGLSPLSRAGLGGTAVLEQEVTRLRGQQGRALGWNSSTSAKGLEEDVNSCLAKHRCTHSRSPKELFCLWFCSPAMKHPAWSCWTNLWRNRAPEEPTVNWAAPAAGKSPRRWMCHSQHLGALTLPWDLWRC